MTSVDLLARDTEWGPGSLDAILTRYSAPLEHSIPGQYPIPAVPCANPRCIKVRKRKPGRNCPWGGLVGGCGYCSTCYSLWRSAGKPETGVPVPMDPAEQRAMARAAATARREAGALTSAQVTAADRMEDFCFLRENGIGLEAAGARVSAHPDTYREYERMRLAGEINGHMGDADDGELELAEAA